MNYFQRKAKGGCTYCGKPRDNTTLKCTACRNLCRTRLRNQSREKQNQYKRVFMAKIKAKAYNILGGRCVCCGEINPKFLTLDHIRNDGYLDKRRRRNLTYLSYKEVVKDKRTDKYQILCWNCNCGKKINEGVCPHKTATVEILLGELK